jgi:hypothetical protein
VDVAFDSTDDYLFLPLRCVFFDVGPQYFEAGPKCIGTKEQLGNVVDVVRIQLSRLFHGRHQPVLDREPGVHTIGKKRSAEGPNQIFIHGDHRIVQFLYWFVSLL